MKRIEPDDCRRHEEEVPVFEDERRDDDLSPRALPPNRKGQLHTVEQIDRQAADNGGETGGDGYDDRSHGEIGGCLAPGRELDADVVGGEGNAGGGNAHQYVKQDQQRYCQEMLVRECDEGPSKDTNDEQGAADREDRFVAEFVGNLSPYAQDQHVGELAQHHEHHHERHRVTKSLEHVDREERSRQVHRELPGSDKPDHSPEVSVLDRFHEKIPKVRLAGRGLHWGFWRLRE